MVAVCIRVSVCVLLIELGQTLTLNENTYKYVRIANSNPGTPGISCNCSTITAMCNCPYMGSKYEIEAPFATLLKNPPPTSLPWPPFGTSYPLPHDFPDGFRELTGNEQPLPEVKVMPRPFGVIRARFKLFLKQNHIISAAHYLRYDNFANWPDAHQRPQQVNVLIHGWTASDVDHSMRSMRAYLLLRNEFANTALISVNWNEAATASYRQSAADSLVIGREVGLLTYKLVETGRTNASHVHLIGVDMGSHIAKIATNIYSRLAQKYNFDPATGKIGERIARRTGLNPLATYFHGVNVGGIYDAWFVDIIHTSTSLNGGDTVDILNRRYGVSTLGQNHVPRPNQVDFYPNNGEFSRQCANAQSMYGCPLYLAIKYFKATLRNGYNRTDFMTNYRMATKRNFQGTSVTIWNGVMGIDAPLTLGRGNQFSTFTVPTGDSQVVTLGKGPLCTNGPSPIPLLGGSFKTCGIAQSPISRLHQGISVKPKEFPWLVCIMTNYIGYIGENLDKNKRIIVGSQFQWPRAAADDTLPVPDSKRLFKDYKPTCTGTLLEPHWVVTAAHCFNDVKNLIPIYLVFGAADCMNPPSKFFNVRRVIVEKRPNDTQTVFIHESFPRVYTPLADAPGDIALVRLKLPVTPSTNVNINPICYREAELYPYADCSRLQVGGYGHKGLNGSDPRLTWMRANLIHLDNPRHSFVNHPKYGVYAGEHPNRLTDLITFGNFEDNLSQGFDRGRSSCGGDSGGPVVDYHLGGDQRATLIAVLRSGTQGCAQASIRQRRKLFDPTYVESDGDGTMWKRVYRQELNSNNTFHGY